MCTKYITLCFLLVFTCICQADIKTRNSGNVIKFDINDDGNADLIFNPDGAGVGTTPSQQLHVTGNGLFSTNLSIGASGGNSTLEIAGSIGHEPETVTSDTTLSGNSVVLADTSSNSVTLTLPSASTVTGRVYTIKQLDTTNTLSIVTTSSENIDNTSGNLTLSSNVSGIYPYMTLVSDGSKWLTLSGADNILEAVTTAVLTIASGANMHFLPSATDITTDAQDTVSAWTDNTGNGWDLSQGTGANQPEYGATGGANLNSINITDFRTIVGDPTGSAKYMSRTSVDAMLKQGNMMCFVAKAKWEATDRTLLEISDSSGNPLISFANISATQSTARNGKNANLKTFTPADTTERMVLISIYRVNSVTYVQIDTETPEAIHVDNGDAQTCDDIYIGATDSGTLPWNNDIAEAVFYANGFEPYLLNQTQRFLNDKYNLGLTITELDAPDTTNLQLWWDVYNDDYTDDGVTNNTLSTAYDCTGNGYNLTQPLSGNRGHLNSGSGYPHFVHDGIDEFLEDNNVYATPNIGDGDATFFFVGYIKFGSADMFIISFCVTKSNRDGFLLKLESDDKISCIVGTSTLGSVTPTSTTARSVLITIRRDGANVYLQIDDDTEVNIATDAGDAGALARHQVGARWDDPGLSQKWDGYFKEFRWYNTLKSASEIQAIQNELSKKWGLGLTF